MKHVHNPEEGLPGPRNRGPSPVRPEESAPARKIRAPHADVNGAEAGRESRPVPAVRPDRDRGRIAICVWEICPLDEVEEGLFRFDELAHANLRRDEPVRAPLPRGPHIPETAQVGEHLSGRRGGKRHAEVVDCELPVTERDDHPCVEPIVPVGHVITTAVINT